MTTRYQHFWVKFNFIELIFGSRGQTDRSFEAFHWKMCFDESSRSFTKKSLVTEFKNRRRLRNVALNLVVKIKMMKFCKRRTVGNSLRKRKPRVNWCAQGLFIIQVVAIQPNHLLSRPRMTAKPNVVRTSFEVVNLVDEPFPPCRHCPLFWPNLNDSFL